MNLIDERGREYYSASLLRRITTLIIALISFIAYCLLSFSGAYSHDFVLAFAPAMAILKLSSAFVPSLLLIILSFLEERQAIYISMVTATVSLLALAAYAGG